MGFLQEYESGKGTKTPTPKTGGYLQQYNSRPNTTVKPTPTSQPKPTPTVPQQGQSLITKVSNQPIIGKVLDFTKSEPVQKVAASAKSIFDNIKKAVDRVGAPVGRAMQKVPDVNLGTKTKKKFSVAPDTEEKIVNFVSNFPSAVIQGYGKSLEQLSSDKGRAQLKTDAKNLPKTMSEVKALIEKKEWQKALETAMSNTAFTVGLDVSSFIPGGMIVKGLKGGFKSGTRQLAKTIVKEAIEEVEKKAIKSTLSQVDDLSRTAKNSLQNVKTGIKEGGIERATKEIKSGKLPPIKVRTLEDGTKVLEDGRHHLEAARQLGIKDYPIEDVTSHYTKPSTGGEIGGVPKELQPLAQEARKYKSVEDFQKALGNRLQYRGGRDMGSQRIIDLEKQNTGGLFFTESPEYAAQYAQDRSKGFGQGGSVYQAVLPKDAKIFDITNEQNIKQLTDKLPKELVKSGDYDSLQSAQSDVARWISAMKDTSNKGAADWATISQYSDEIEKAGFDGFRAIERPGKVDINPDGSFKVSGKPVYSTALFKGGIPGIKDIKEFYNKAISSVEIPKGVTPKAKTPIQPKTSGVAKQIESKAVEKGMVDKGYSELAQYDSSTIKAQSKAASKYTIDDMNKIATGEKPLPKELKPGTPLSVAEDYAIKNNDTELLRKLANSPLAKQISESASELSLSRMRDSNSPVKIMRDIAKIKEEAFKKRYAGKSVKEVSDKVVADIKKKVKPVDKYDWNNFVKSLPTC